MPTPVALVWDVADAREEADTECRCFVVSRLLLLGLLLGGYCGRREVISCWDGVVCRFDVELAAEGRFETLLLLVVSRVVCDSSPCSPFGLLPAPFPVSSR